MWQAEAVVSRMKSALEATLKRVRHELRVKLRQLKILRESVRAEVRPELVCAAASLCRYRVAS